MNGDAYGGRWNGVRPSGVLESVTRALAGGSSSLASLSDSLGGFGSCKNRISAGFTEIMSPGANRVLASECYSERKKVSMASESNRRGVYLFAIQQDVAMNH